MEECYGLDSMAVYTGITCHSGTGHYKISTRVYAQRDPEYTTLHYKIMQQVSTRSAQPHTLTVGCYAGTTSCVDPDLGIVNCDIIGI